MPGYDDDNGEDGIDDFYDDRDDDDDDRFERDDDLIDGVGFQDPGGRSSLRAATSRNPRNLPCPQCGAPNQLTPIDRQRHYVCNRCADRAEGLLPQY
jgi:hypothetical protein